MITTKTVKIEMPENLTSNYIEEKLRLMNFDVLRWAITDYYDKYYTLDIAVVE